MYCKKCGTELRENDTFCYYCGNRIGWMQRMLSSKAFIGSVIAVFVVIIAAVLTYFIWTGKITMPSFDKGQTTEQNKIVDSGKSGSKGNSYTGTDCYTVRVYSIGCNEDDEERDETFDRTAETIFGIQRIVLCKWFP